MDTIELRAALIMADMKLGLALEQDECWLSIIDTAGQEQTTLLCTPEQAAAIYFLAINSGYGPEGLIAGLYKIAEPVIADLPHNLRPIP